MERLRQPHQMRRLTEWCQRANQQEQFMKRMCLAALTGALAISAMAVAIDVASATTRAGVYRAGVNRVGVARVGVNRVGIGYRRVGLTYRGGWNGYYRRGVGVAAGVALGAAAAGAYASAADTAIETTEATPVWSYSGNGGYIQDTYPSVAGMSLAGGGDNVGYVGRAGLGYGRVGLGYGRARLALGAAAAGAYASAADMSSAVGSNVGYAGAARSIYATRYMSAGYYGPVCDPRINVLCQ
jgi:hypothetical protein